MMGERFLAPVARSQSAFALGLSSLLRTKREPEKCPLLSRRGRHELGAARPFQTPKGKSKWKNASRFAKRIFLHLSDLLLRSKLHAFAGRKVLLRRDTLGEAVKWRNVKKALSEAASFFPFRLLLWNC